MRSARELLHQLDLMVLLAEPFSFGLGSFLAGHLPLLSVVLGLTVHELLALSTLVDEVLIFYLGPALRQHREKQKQARQDTKAQQVNLAGQQLRERMRWNGDQAELDVGLLLGSLGHGPQKHLLFVSPWFEVGLPRSLLREAGKALGHRNDLQAFLDARGLHLRWNQGKGRLDFVPQPRVAIGPEVLVVQLGRMAQEHFSQMAAQ